MISVKEYVEGPLDDIDRPGTGDIYVFTKQIESVDIYIKLKIDNGVPQVRIAKCISFHKAEYEFNKRK